MVFVEYLLKHKFISLLYGSNRAQNASKLTKMDQERVN
jgi:hypothetical protein